MELQDLVGKSGAIGSVSVKAYRVGGLYDPEEGGKPFAETRGLNFAHSEKAASEYRFAHEGSEVTQYLITAQNVYVATDLFQLCQEWLGKPFLAAVEEENERLRHVAETGLKAQIAATKAVRKWLVESRVYEKMRKAGYDAVILTHPSKGPDLRPELSVIQSTVAIREAAESR